VLVVTLALLAACSPAPEYVELGSVELGGTKPLPFRRAVEPTGMANFLCLELAAGMRAELGPDAALILDGERATLSARLRDESGTWHPFTRPLLRTEPQAVCLWQSTDASRSDLRFVEGEITSSKPWPCPRVFWWASWKPI
jgi:hypothetical protein